MRKELIWVSLFLCIFFLGCKTMDYYNACKGDTACVQKMQEAQRVATSTVSTAGSMAPVPTNIVDIVGGIIGAIVFFGSGVFYGRRKVLKGTI